MCVCVRVRACVCVFVCTRVANKGHTYIIHVLLYAGYPWCVPVCSEPGAAVWPHQFLLHFGPGNGHGQGALEPAATVLLHPLSDHSE